MDIQLHELIDKIKKDGIESAQTEAAKLKAGAEEEAKKIIADARRQAEGIIAEGKADAERSEKAGIAALEQASRNLVLAFKGGIQDLLDNLVGEAVSSSYSVDMVKTILPEMIKNWAAKNTDSLTVVLSEGDVEKLDGAFRARLASSLKGGVDLRAGKNIEAGFHIAEKDGSAFYDFSAEAVAAMLSAYLNPRLAEILTSGAKGL